MRSWVTSSAGRAQPQVGVQRREGLIQQEQLGTVHQHPGQRHPLLLSARQLAGLALFQIAKLEHGQRLVQRPFPTGLVPLPVKAAGQVLPDRHVRKQGVVLEQVPHPALLWLQVDPPFSVEQHPSIQFDAAPVRALDASDALQRHALAAAGGAQQAGDTIYTFKAGPEMEIPHTFFDIHQQAHFAASFRPPSSRFTASSTAALMARFTSTHLNAPALSPVR